ncbi:MAG: glycosyltransferase N-terminal domain-containing protein [Melioribacteraceae bacterium]|nr:glycosyltransferase N-terminal domain-containing protein [Melioribacteraceae bacterium]
MSPFNSKIREGIKDRHRLFKDLIINLSGLDRKKKLLWFHSSSMGEFEQAKPIIEKIKKNADINILVTFFSPSGYKNSLKYPFADIISYLPFDSTRNSKRFVSLVRPSAVIFMRYDFWPNLIWILNKYNIPTFIVDATMRRRSKRKWFFSKQFHSSLFKNFLRILTISQKDKSSFEDFNIPEGILSVVGDTRFDRVYQKSLGAKRKNLFKKEILEGKKVIVLGSTWEADEEVIFPAIKKLFKYYKNLLIIIAPHEPTSKRLEELQYSFRDIDNIRFSYMNDYSNEKVIIIDSIGILLTLYYYADIAYVGGSFRQGIHSVLEPAVYGIPVVFGPKNGNSHEARKMIDLGCGIEISNRFNTYRTFRRLITDDEKRNEIGKIALDYVEKNIGATEKIIYELANIKKKGE